MNARPNRGPVASAWALMASESTTVFLVLLLSLAAAVAVLVPQGTDALDIARDPNAVLLQSLAAWGLTDVFGSSWVRALGVLLAANLLAVVLGRFGQTPAAATMITPPDRPPLEEILEAPYPESTVERLRDRLIARLGPPAAEQAKRDKVVMVFDAGSDSSVGPLLAHVGLLLLVLSAGLHASGGAAISKTARARFEITDSRTKAVGHFDMVAGEAKSFFQWPTRYIVLDYVRNREGLGPAVRLEMRGEGASRGSAFWVYLDAPKGFDAKHRGSEVAIVAQWMGMVAPPGKGLADSPIGALMILGLGALCFGVLAQRKPRGRVWVEAHGNRVAFKALPEREGDPAFAARFRRWALEARAVLSS